MFERYTEPARRVIFFARYEASQFGSTTIETEHLLLGVIREDQAFLNRLLRTPASIESIRTEIQNHSEPHEKTSTAIDLPLSGECKRILAYTAEESQLGSMTIGVGHLLLGILRAENCFAAKILKDLGLELEAARKEVAQLPAPPETPRYPVDPYPSIPKTSMPEAGVVPDAETAKRIAQAVWLARLSPTGDSERVETVIANLTLGVWIVTGTFTSTNTPFSLAAFIQKEDAKILRVNLEKATS